MISNELTFIHDTLFFDNTLIKDLSETQKGRLNDFLDLLPTADEIDDLENDSRDLDRLSRNIKSELKYIDSKVGKNELLSYTTAELLDYYKDALRNFLKGE